VDITTAVLKSTLKVKQRYKLKNLDYETLVIDEKMEGFREYMNDESIK
jgi:hypothetical protein